MNHLFGGLAPAVPLESELVDGEKSRTPLEMGEDGMRLFFETTEKVGGGDGFCAVKFELLSVVYRISS